MRSAILSGLLLVTLTACSPAVPPIAQPSAAPPTAGPSAPIGSPRTGLHEGPAFVACDAIGVDYAKVRFDIDPAAPDPVTGYSDAGTRLGTSWAPGFRLGEPAERAVYGPDGAVVVKDGDVLAVGDRLGDYFVCFGPDRLSIASQEPE